MRRWPTLVALVATLCACGGPVQPPTPVALPRAATAAAQPPEPPGFDPSTVPERDERGDLLRIPDGTFLGGNDAAVGAYRSTGARPGVPLCSWSVNSEYDAAEGKSSGGAGQQVAAGVAGAGVVARLLLGDGQQLTTAGCEVWVRYG